MSEDDNIKLNNQLTNAMEQSPSLETNRSSASLEITRNLYTRIHKRPPPVPILSLASPVNTYPSHFLKIPFNIIFFPI